MFRLRRKATNRESVDVEEEKPMSVTRLNGAAKYVRRIIFLPEHNLVVAANADNVVRVYNADGAAVGAGKPRTEFKRHTFWVNDVVQLDSDVVASVGDDRCLFTWRADSASLVGEWVHNAGLWSVAKFGESKIIVGDYNGGVTVLSHKSATSFQVHRRLENAHSYFVNDIAVHGDFLVTCSSDKSAKVWDADSLTVRASLPNGDGVWSAAVNAGRIVTTCGGPKLCVFRNAPDFKLDFVLELPETYVGVVNVLNDDIFAVASGHYLYFISLPAKSVISRIRVEAHVRSFTVLVDGRIAVGGDGGYCAIITPPESMQGVVDDCVRSLYPSFSIAAARMPPLRAAWLAVRDRQLTLAEACRTIITSDNCTASLEEWCAAHDLLMEAVKREEIPASRHLENSIAHWHLVLYQHCAKLTMGEKCIDFVMTRFKEAEDVGVIAKGQIESLINTIGIRHDMDKDNRFLVHATYQLFIRQAEMDVQLRKVLRCQRTQQITSLVNAVIGCIPVGGAIATNVLSGGASILNDMQVCGFVESALGIGKDICGGFGSDQLLDRFLSRTNSVMSVEEWRKVPSEKRKVVEDAASSLGLTIDELREKLLTVANTQMAGDELSSELIMIEEVDDEDKIDPVKCADEDDEGITPLSMVRHIVEDSSSSAAGMGTTDSPDRAKSALMHWKEIGISKDIVGAMESGEAAACFAAFFLNYESAREVPFSRLKQMMAAVFDRKVIYGESFTEADEEEKKTIIDLLVKALAEVTDEDAVALSKMRVKKFFRLATQ